MPPLSREQLFEEVQKVLRGPCGVDGKVSESSLLAEDLRLDSVGMLALAVSLENRFRIRLPDESDAAPQTVGELVDLLQQAIEAKS